MHAHTPPPPPPPPPARPHARTHARTHARDHTHTIHTQTSYTSSVLSDVRNVHAMPCDRTPHTHTHTQSAHPTRPHAARTHSSPLATGRRRVVGRLAAPAVHARLLRMRAAVGRIRKRKLPDVHVLVVGRGVGDRVRLVGGGRRLPVVRFRFRFLQRARGRVGAAEAARIGALERVATLVPATDGGCEGEGVRLRTGHGPRRGY